MKEIDLVNLKYEEFRELIEISLDQNLTIPEIISDRMPALIKGLKNFDPTGISGYFVDILDDQRKLLQEELLYKSLFSLFKGLESLQNRIENTEELLKEKGVNLLSQYLTSSQRTKDEMIESYKNLFINSLIEKSSIDEDLIYFDVLDKINFMQVQILKIPYDKFTADYQNHITLTQLKESLNNRLSESIIMFMTSDLIGKGLLQDAGIGTMGYQGPVTFSINTFTINFIKRLIQL